MHTFPLPTPDIAKGHSAWRTSFWTGSLFGFNHQGRMMLVFIPSAQMLRFDARALYSISFNGNGAKHISFRNGARQTA